MFDKFIDLILDTAGLFKFWAIVNPNSEGLITTLGRETRKLSNGKGLFGTGFFLKAPFGIEQEWIMSLATRVEEMAAQTLVSKDGKNVVAGVVVTYRVHSVSKALWSIYEPFNGIHDSVQSTFADAVLHTDYADLTTPAFMERMTEECRKKGFKYGFEIDSVKLSEFAPTRTYRLIGNGAEL